LKRLLAQLRYPQPHLASLGLQLTLVMPSTGIATGFAALIALRIAQPIRLGLQQRVQCLLHATADHAVQVILDPLIVNCDDIAQRTRCSLSHGGSFLLSWLRLATSSSARFGAASPTRLCETFPTSSFGAGLRMPKNDNVFRLKCDDEVLTVAPDGYL